MKILYGVQATGQGHISRARAMAEAFQSLNADVTWLFSGRARDRLFDMAPFGNFEHREGLTFYSEAGQVYYLRTLLNAKPITLIKDVLSLNVSHYDLVVTDYEPVTAWAGRLRNKPVIGLGHQYAFGKATPKSGDTWLQRLVMTTFAPVARPVGLHWASFDQHVLPPILDLPADPPGDKLDHVVVYLPFEDQDHVTAWLQGFPQYCFRQYAANIDDSEQGNVSRRRASIAGFKRDLAQCRGVICNSGFELISECLHWRKPVLTRPLSGQMEQLSNAAALKQLGYATVMDGLDINTTTDWLQNTPVAPKVSFSDVAGTLAKWLASGATDPIEQIQRELWA